MEEELTMQQVEKPDRREPWKHWLFGFGLFALLFLYTEICLHLLIFGWPDQRIIYPILFSLCFAGLCSLLLLWLPPLPQRIIGTLICVATVVWALVQYVYQACFGNLMPLSNLALGGNVADFRTQLIYEIKRNIPQILVLFLPLPAWIFLLIRKWILRVRLGWRQALASLGAVLVFFGAALGVMYLARNNSVSVLRMFNSSDTATTSSYRVIGMNATTMQELRYILFPQDAKDASVLYDRPAASFDTERCNVLDIDFEALAQSAEDETQRKLDKFFLGQQPTEKNDYTGYLEGYNVISFCAESYAPWFISEELTPTLYKMVNNGFVFQNYYGCYNAVTTNGEYTMCTGLFPDMSRSKVASSFDASIGHYLPYCLGNCLKDAGYQTFAYHNYIGEFYNRNLTHTNMGYLFQSASDGMEITGSWPASDLEMMEQSVDDYVNSGKPFHAYYMTFSGHYQYDWLNAMSAKHQDRVRDLPYSETVKAYIACNLEVEDALTYLMERLEQAGVADKTLIVLTNDHYPYGLKEEEYNELAGQPLDTVFEKYRNSFICYTPSMEEPVYVDDYCCTIDILPTVLNLLGQPYDSRMLAGTDVLSSGQHVAIIENGSFLTRDFRYNSETGEVIPHAEGVSVTDEELAAWQTLIDQKYEYSRDILNCDYYSHVFGKSGLDISMDDAINFTDIKKIFIQSSASWLVAKGYMDPISETEFGASLKVTLGEYLEGFYRIAERPKTDSSHLPDGYTKNANAPERFNREKLTKNYPDPVTFNEQYPYYDAVCWAFEVGLIREGDRATVHDETINYYDVALIAARFCRWKSVDVHIAELTDENGDPIDRLTPLAEQFPDLTAEELEAAVWCFDEHIISRSHELELQLQSSYKIVPRSGVVAYLFRICAYELQMT